MDRFFILDGIEFEWDEEKYALNLRKHGVRFEEAAEVFFDPYAQSGDTSVVDEDRSYYIGWSFSRKTLVVVFVERGSVIRIVSARKANRSERKKYEETR